MFINHVTTAITNLLKNRLFAAINIIGLAIGLAACIMIALYVKNETSYDQHWDNVERIFRITTTADRTGTNPIRMGESSLLLLPAMREVFADEIEYSSRAMDFLVEEVYVGSTLFEQTIVPVERELIDIFGFEVLHGSLEATLENPGFIALSAEVALRFFGREDVLGEVLALVDDDAREDFRVGAVYRFPQGNTVLKLPAMRLLDPDALEPTTWMAFSSQNYIQLKPGVDPGQIRARLTAFTDQHVDIGMLEPGPGVRPSDRIRFELQNMADVYLDSPFEGPIVRGNPNTVLVFAIIAVLVLVIGCINFTILSMARATQRVREVAMRKSIGASRWQLILQFLVESWLVVLLGMMLSLVVLELAMPWFETLVGASLNLSLASPATWLSLLALLLSVGIAGSLYPGLLLSGLRPAATLKANRSLESVESIRFRTALVVFQFGVSIALMVATAVVYAQLQYTLNRDPGFARENLLVLENLLVRPEVHAGKAVLKQEIAGLPGVSSVSLSGHQPMQTRNLSTIILPFAREDEPGVSASVAALSVDHDFFRTYQIPLVAGRDFQQERDPISTFYPWAPQDAAAGGNVIINASAARILGFADPEQALGRQVSASTWAQHRFTIIGVVADTQFYTLRNTPRAEVYVLTPTYSEVLTVRFEGSPAAVLARIDEQWRAIMGDALLTTSFVDQNMAAVFERERREAEMLIGFSLLAIVIACLGLFGAAVFNVERRTREIGIRKVLGAEAREIVRLLLWQFTRPVILANLIAWPIATWAMLAWLQRFPYQIDPWLLLPLCTGAGLIALLIAWSTVGGMAAKAANTRPVLALRYE